MPSREDVRGTQSELSRLYSECVQNKAVKRDCHLKEATAFTFVPIRLIRVREKNNSLILDIFSVF